VYSPPPPPLFFFPVPWSPPFPPPPFLFFGASIGFQIVASRCELSDHIHSTHHSLQDSPGRMISRSHRPLPDNIQHSQQTTNTYVSVRIRTQNTSKRVPAYPRLRSRGHWDRPSNSLVFFNLRALVVRQEIITLVDPDTKLQRIEILQDYTRLICYFKEPRTEKRRILRRITDRLLCS